MALGGFVAIADRRYRRRLAQAEGRIEAGRATGLAG
jgi:hypothetical protein